MIPSEPEHYSAYIAVIGRPNVGKSTFINAQVERKVSIVSPRPQTTRQRIIGVQTCGHYQMIYVDTPGYHQVPEESSMHLNHYLNNEVKETLLRGGVDIILWMVEALKWTADDTVLLSFVEKLSIPVFLIINKIDTVKEKHRLLAYIQSCQERTKNIHSFKECLLLSAQDPADRERMNSCLKKYMQPGPFYFGEETQTDRSSSFRMAEIIREKAILCLQQELPYSLAVQIEQIREEPQCLHVHAVLWVERESQKRIVIGEKGAMLRRIGTQARLECETLFQQKLMLRLWVKVKDHWSRNAAQLKNLGYH
jgi:GTPase